MSAPLVHAVHRPTAADWAAPEKVEVLSERARHPQCAGAALHDARQDQDQRGRRERAGEGRHAEPNQAENEHAEPAERVGEGARQQDWERSESR
ncbi:MAG: hypothetical protein JWP66_1600 [Naasia sp.]|nr:hypothetical protein [Naasia sp.]